MAELNELEWHRLIRVSKEDLDRWLFLTKEATIKDNLTARFYQLKADENGVDEQGFINYLLGTVVNYVFDDAQIREMEEDGDDPMQSALKFFGKVNPISDGRYGELILYTLTEGVLGTPLIVHKISHSYSPNKQVEGSDGLFMGALNERLSLLIGESKMQNVFSIGLPNAMGSINRFHDGSDALEHEIKVARNHLSKDLNNLDQEALQKLYNAFKPSKDEFKALQLAHPILLIYKEKDIATITEDIENKIREFIVSKCASREKSIGGQCGDFNEEVVLNFFLIPVKDVSSFRKDLYKAFHNGEEYQEENPT